ncbi:MAG: efflux RND transporter periplasmic adaptor subunit [Bacteroidales bacterium]|jgi:HlyD family secretion protein|nr:efflux RND transporter periplasmic adaptor subunit [Bacteroidales bacterium]MCR5572078.1 efflux RND transporter periplasmic adaptor subunit [Bacteroidales bacterium]
MKKIIYGILLTALAVLVIGTFVFLFKKSRPKTVEYEELTVAVADIQRTTVVTGKIEPRNEVNVKPQINGIIAELYKEAGQQVQQNEVIAKLKVIPDMNSLSSAQSRVRLADINLAQAQTNFNREKDLYDKHLVSAEEFEQVRQSFNQAVEEQKAAKDALEVIRDGVSSSNATSSSTLVRSTITGLILDVPVKVGNSVIQANTMNDGTTVATVADMNDLIFDGNIDETEVGGLSEGMPVIITIGALQDYRFEAVLEYVAPKAVESNGANQFEIKAAVKVPTDGTMIRSGYSANAEVVLQEVRQVVAVPESALEFDGGKTYVYLKDGDSFERREIETGLSDGLNIEVKSGLNVGDVVRGNAVIAEE